MITEKVYFISVKTADGFPFDKHTLGPFSSEAEVVACLKRNMEDSESRYPTMKLLEAVLYEGTPIRSFPELCKAEEVHKQ